MKQNFSEATIHAVESYTFLTDRFLAVAFNKPVAEHVLSVIMGIDLTVKHIERLPVMGDFFSGICCFAVLAEDATGKTYNIEVQNFNAEDFSQRTRYYREEPDELDECYPEMYRIFITEKDVLKHGRPIYHIVSRIRESGERFNDGETIIFVNGEIKDTSTALGQLMADMQQPDAAKISNKALADRMKELKQGYEFARMCNEIEEFVDGVCLDERIKAVKVFLSCGLDDKTITAKMAEQYKVSEENARMYIAKARSN